MSNFEIQLGLACSPLCGQAISLPAMYKKKNYVLADQPADQQPTARDPRGWLNVANLRHTFQERLQPDSYSMCS